ncbi:MAG: dockerin type I repeat-containing protein, partial [Bacteroidales bacterium]|nr:dockerin type I repeat-containing protein [Bacteroidales bacterium]MDY5207419.1 dockerin type I repeat-containing protein [Sodaliphilus sp.]
TWTHSPATFTEAGAVSVTATATYGGVSAETTCPVTVKTIANTKETAYTVEQAIALIDAGKDLATPVYVKGIVSEITTPYSTQYKNISFNVSDDGTTTVPQFEFFRNQKDAENKYAEDPNIKVGATVIGYGTLTKFGQTYEFNAGNYLVEYIAPTLAGDINGDGVVNTSDVTALVNAVLGDGDVTLEIGDLNDDGVLDVTDATMLIYLLGEEN